MASSLLALSDLIRFQLERIKLDEFTYKDELHLLRQLLALDMPQPMHALHSNGSSQEHNQPPQAGAAPPTACTPTTQAQVQTQLPAHTQTQTPLRLQAPQHHQHQQQQQPPPPQQQYIHALGPLPPPPSSSSPASQYKPKSLPQNHYPPPPTQSQSQCQLSSAAYGQSCTNSSQQHQNANHHNSHGHSQSQQNLYPPSYSPVQQNQLNYTQSQKQRQKQRRFQQQNSKRSQQHLQQQQQQQQAQNRSKLHVGAPSDSDGAGTADESNNAGAGANNHHQQQQQTPSPGGAGVYVGAACNGGIGALGSSGELADEELVGAVGGGANASNGGIGGSEDGSSASSNADLHKDFKVQVLEWFQQLYVQTESFRSDEESQRVREAGNNCYRKEHHPLKACDLYTEAIFLAPVEEDADNTTAAMAHANRSTVLHDYGMYEEAYDDCLCALELGYPEEYNALIKLRQAACALKLRNFALCELHVHELLHMDLSEAFEARTHELWHECEVLKSEKVDMGVQTDDDHYVAATAMAPQHILHGSNSNRLKVYEVAWSDTSNAITTTRRAYLRATTDIVRHMPIFSEEAAIFVSSGQARICDNCAITQFIPFPCDYCSNRTSVYCSRKCRAQHSSIHVLECFAHQIELFEEFGDAFAKPRLLQLAFRMLITGLPQVMPHCRKRPTVNKMWNAFNGILTERTDIPYSALLRLEAHLDKIDAETTVSLAIAAHILAIYLAECTDFFEHLDLMMPATTKLTRSEWILLSAALLLRHIGQLRHKHLTHCPSFVLPADPHILSPLHEFSLWSAVKHIRQGQLHLLAGDVACVAYAVYPQTLSLCRQSCAGQVYRKHSGRQVTAYATCDILLGACIGNCFVYAGDYRESLYETRRQDLKARGIDCKCDKCFRPYPDEDFHKFHRYRCDNPKCMQIFTPNASDLKYTRNLRWWRSSYYTHPNNEGADLLVCSACDETQKLEWFWTFNAALSDCDSVEMRCKLYAAVERADTQLVEMNECKVALARQLVEQCLLMHREGHKPLDDWEFNKLGSIMRNALNIVAAQYGVFSIEYIQHMSYFWDIMALSNYKCGDKELMQMLQALEYIPDEYKEIFINYYDDFITPKFAEETYTSLMDTQV
ncbi:uncharacterized protein LOC105223498 isoform X1 [Bactrocera dorsalis]|uniref:Uncharacterized protein LOC105223498 isoform X1 n=1 Tax=Bactrocera dorsalis TaxID=27457 RepID=A0A6I9UQI2_BACDO|nr:uncharacterized protein LOC105223498 isoform X1 [Bactrocera dorsalis]